MNNNLTKTLQLTLAILKPHVLKQPNALKGIQEKILQSNFKVVRSKRNLLTLKQVEEFYKEHQGKFFYNRLITFMTSGPSDFYILTKHNAISEWRKLMGPTKVFKTIFSDPDTIRGLYGLSDTRNATHGSDSPESAKREIKIFFPEFNIENWYEKEEYLYRTNKVKLCKNKFVHKPVTNNLNNK